MDGNTYYIYYDGKIYNKKEIKEELRTRGFSFGNTSDEELLVTSYHLWRT